MSNTISDDFVRGYTAAIQDIIEQYNLNCPDIAKGKKMTINLTKRFLERFLEERSKFRNWHGTDKCRMVWNTETEDFEPVVNKDW